MASWTRENFQQSAVELVEALRAFQTQYVQDQHHHLTQDHETPKDISSAASPQLLDWKLSSEVDSNSTNTLHLIHPPVCSLFQRAKEWTAASSLLSGDEYSVFEDELVGNDKTAKSSSPFLDESVYHDPDVVDIAPETNWMWHFSIVYSETYACPVLYFAVQELDGTPCERDAVCRCLSSLIANRNSRSSAQTNSSSSQSDCLFDDDDSGSWDFVSYEEHPHTRLPSCFLHPCRTRDRLETLFSISHTHSSEESIARGIRGRHLLSWMSLIFPSVGFAIPSKTFVALRSELIKQP